MSHSSPRKVSTLTYESLEVRRVLAAAFPSAQEQYVLELINSARANPAGYAASLGIDLNEGLAPGTISSAAKPPLAFNYLLVDAAQKHSDWQLDTDSFSHTGANGSNPERRMRDAGYSFTGNWTWGENIGYIGSTGPVDTTDFAKRIEENLFIDRGVVGRGHRISLMNERFMEVGVGARYGNFRGYNAVMMTQDFARSTGPYLTGVAYSDLVIANRFYTPGEGLGGITITAIRDGGDQRFQTQTTAAGGYSLQLPKGRYSIMASGPGLGDSQFLSDVLIGTNNRKLDFVTGVVRQSAEVAVYGNNRSIVNNDSSPSTADFTDFGSTSIQNGTVTRTFTIKNHGNVALNLNGSTRVFTSSPEFTVSSLPPQSVAPGGTVTFSVTFDPSAAGTRTAVVQFASDDKIENPFTFTVSGLGAEGMPPQGLRPYSGDQSSSGSNRTELRVYSLPVSTSTSTVNPLAGHQQVLSVAIDAAFRSMSESQDEANERKEFWASYDHLGFENL
jgi:uncharacterized protein YkwD